MTYPPLTEEQRKALKVREASYIHYHKTGELIHDDYAKMRLDPNHPEVKAAMERMCAAVGLRAKVQ
jgi:hypothetical protein